jgi:type VI secretion system protein ImpL
MVWTLSVLMLGGLCSPVWWRWKQKKYICNTGLRLQRRRKKELHNPLTNLRSFLRTRYGLFWRYKVRLFLIIGEPAEVESIAPGLTGQRWLEGDGIVLIHGGKR